MTTKYNGNINDLLKGLWKLQVQDNVKYHSYINVDALLSLQNPRTSLSDEVTFIVIHQQFELLAKLCIQEISLIQKSYVKLGFINESVFEKRLLRVNAYFKIILDSLDLLSPKFFDTEEFFQFRMALYPASGFQTAQFRQIEFMMTQVENLTFQKSEMKLLGIKYSDEEENLEYMRVYWKLGGRDRITGEKLEMLKDFEERYDDSFIDIIGKNKEINLNSILERENISDSIIDLYRELQQLIVDWKIKHIKTIIPHFKLFRQLNDKYNWKVDPRKGTGDTNAIKYLNSGMQIRYFPSLKVQLADKVAST